MYRAADWFSNVGTAGTPLPVKQCCTYDIIDFAKYDHVSGHTILGDVFVPLRAVLSD